MQGGETLETEPVEAGGILPPEADLAPSGAEGGGDPAPAAGEAVAAGRPAAEAADVSRETLTRAAVEAFVAASLKRVAAAAADPNFHANRGWFLPAAAALLRSLCEDGPANYLSQEEPSE